MCLFTVALHRDASDDQACAWGSLGGAHVLIKHKSKTREEKVGELRHS